MAVKIFIRRKFKTDRIREASKAINMVRYGAMDQKGYISSETLSDLKDPTRVTVVSMWHDMDAWEAWRNSERRRRIETEMAGLTEGTPEYEYFSLGMGQDA
jgi:heme-degrading monooxygenase HmoA